MTSTPDDLRGLKVGGFVVEHQLGAGGMGSVWFARNAITGEPAAVKVAHAELLHHPQHLDRFVKEAMAAMRVKHENVVRTVDVSQLADGRYYLIMEYLDGLDLGEYLRRFGKLGADDALKVLGAIAAALEALHQEGIVHRDLKPSNVILVRRRPGETESDAFAAGPADIDGYVVKLVDFGLAKVAPKAGRPAAGATHVGLVAGTPGYMAPEQVLAFAEVDARADVYSLGMIGIHMVAGRLPFVRDGDEGNMLAILDRARTLPGEPAALLAAEASHLPPGWAGPLLHAIAHEVGHRIQLVRDLPLQLAAVTESGERTLRKVARQFWEQAPPSASTIKNPRDQVPTALHRHPPPAAPPSVPAQPTTLGGAAGAVSAAHSPRHRSAAVALVVGGVAAIGIVVSLIVLGVGRDTERHAERPHDAAPAVADAVPAIHDTWVITDPLRATLYADGKPIGESPARIRAPVGSTVVVRAELPGHETVERALVVSSDRAELELMLPRAAAMTADAGPGLDVRSDDLDRDREKPRHGSRKSEPRVAAPDAGVPKPPVSKEPEKERDYDPSRPLGPR